MSLIDTNPSPSYYFTSHNWPLNEQIQYSISKGGCSILRGLEGVLQNGHKWPASFVARGGPSTSSGLPEVELLFESPASNDSRGVSPKCRHGVLVQDHHVAPKSKCAAGSSLEAPKESLGVKFWKTLRMRSSTTAKTRSTWSTFNIP